MQVYNTEKAVHTDLQKSNPLQTVYPSWLYRLAISPRATLSAILEQDRPVWLVPLLIVTLLVVLEAVIYSHTQMTSVSSRILGQEFMKNLSPEEQAFQFRLIGPPIRPLYVYVTPIIYSASRLWVAWFLFSLFMNLILTSAGANSSFLRTQNMTAWVFLPLGLRYLIQSVTMLVSHTAIVSRGLSSLVASSPSVQQIYYLAAFLQSLLGSVDIFFLWLSILLVLAVVVGFQLPGRGKAVTLGLLGVAIVLLLMTLSGYLIILLQSEAGGVIRRVSWYFQFAW